jgi:hypothetical protein
LFPDKMTTVSTYIRVSRLEEALSHRHLSVGKSPEPAIHRFEVAPATKQLKKTKQSALLLKGIGEKYTLVANHDIPTISHKDEILVKVRMSPISSNLLTSYRSWLLD